MTHPQVSRKARRARQKDTLRDAARVRPAEDPQLRRMLISHMHCGQEMQLIIPGPALPDEGATAHDGGILGTYRCACGFSFDVRRN